MMNSRIVQPNRNTPIRVLIVDDSAFMRFSLESRLKDRTDLVVIGTARNGQEALAMIPELDPDVITLDVEMPGMDGLTTLRRINRDFPRPVIMVSSLTTEGADTTIRALTLGAVDFVAKPSSKANISSIVDELVEKINRAAGVKITSEAPVPNQPLSTTPVTKHSRPLLQQEKVVVIGTSTGGPRALNTIIPMLSSNLRAAVLIVQHMPVGFTRSLAQRLDNLSPFKITEAQAGDPLEVGKAYVAPGGYHMVLSEKSCIDLIETPPVHGVRPAVDVTIASVVKFYKERTVGVIMTGMGSDGSTGAALIKACGGIVIAEHESTCVVWGMPRSVQEAGMATTVVPLTGIPAAICQAVNGSLMPA